MTTTTPIFRELLQHTRALRALAAELVGDASADDVVQEAAIQTMLAPPKRSGPVRGWLASVVRNVARNQRRAERIRRQHEERAARTEATPPDRSAEDADSMQRLTEVVTSLPEPYRATILARYLRDQTPTEIADATGTPLATVKTRLQRGLVLLRERLDEEDAGEWRAMFAVAFALRPPRHTSKTFFRSKTMKLTLGAAALAPIAIALWNDDSAPPAQTQHASAPAASESQLASADPRPTTPTADDESKPAAKESTPAPTAPAPAAVRPLLRLDAAGPAAFREAFLPTNLGDLLASEDGTALWRPLLTPIEHMWRQFDGSEGFDATRDRVLDYAGRIRVLWMVEPGTEDEDDHAYGVFALEADGATDLSALAGDLSRVVERIIPEQPVERTVGDHTLAMIGSGREFVTMPLVVEGSVLAFFGESGSLEQTVPKCLQALAADTDRPTAPISFQVDLAQLKELAEVRSEPELVKAFGLESLRSLQAVVRANGPHVELGLEVAFGDGERGILGALFPDVDTLPQLLRRVPREATPWLTMPLRLDVLFDVVMDTAEEFGEENVRQDVRNELGLDLGTELFAHLSGEVMVLGDLWRARDPELFRDGEDPDLGACVAFSLRDAAAFGRGFDKLLAHLKGVVHKHETRTVEGVEITRLGSSVVGGMHMAVGQDLFAMAFGDEGVTQLEALVTGSAQSPDSRLPEAVIRVQHHAPRGWNGLGLANLRALFGGQVTLVMEMLEDALPRQMGFEFSTDETQERLDKVLPLLVRHELDHLVTMTGWDEGTWRLRTLW